MILSRRRRSDARQKFSPAIFLSPIVVAKFIFFCAKFIISSHLATMAIGSANPAGNSSKEAVAVTFPCRLFHSRIVRGKKELSEFSETPNQAYFYANFWFCTRTFPAWDSDLRQFFFLLTRLKLLKGTNI